VQLAAVAACHTLWSAVPVLFTAGVAWVAIVATVNVAAQIALPAAMRARGLSIFMIVFGGMMAIGSASWGVTADFAGIPWTFAASAFCLFAFDCAATRWRIPGDEVPTVTIGEPVGQSR
jgi:Transmembrane secretion effector